MGTLAIVSLATEALGEGSEVFFPKAWHSGECTSYSETKPAWEKDRLTHSALDKLAEAVNLFSCSGEEALQPETPV